MDIIADQSRICMPDMKPDLLERLDSLDNLLLLSRSLLLSFHKSTLIFILGNNVLYFY